VENLAVAFLLYRLASPQRPCDPAVSRRLPISAARDRVQFRSLGDRSGTGRTSKLFSKALNELTSQQQAIHFRAQSSELCFLFPEMATKPSDINICYPAKLKLWKFRPRSEEKPPKSIPCRQAYRQHGLSQLTWRALKALDSVGQTFRRDTSSSSSLI
jgi:hypothetical protein